MKKNNTIPTGILVAGFIIFTVLAFYTLLSREPNPPINASLDTAQQYETKQLTIWDKVSIPVEIADTPEKTTLGLSYRDSLPENQGMLFIFSEPHIPTFWMKGMNFPLDIIWIDENNTIVDISLNVPTPDSQTPEYELPRYSPNRPAKMVLEVNAGFTDRYGIEVGNTIDLSR